MSDSIKIRTSRTFGRTVTEETLVMVRLMVAAMLTDRAIRRIMSRADKISQDAGQVAHGYPHAMDVRELVEHVLEQVGRLRPQLVSERDRLVGIASAILHDSGRAIDVANHDKWSAVIADRYLRSLALRLFGDRNRCPEWFRQGVVQGTRKHRSESILYKDAAEKARRRKEVTDVALAALLIADKLCGSEVRVPQVKSELLDTLKSMTVSPLMRKRYGLDETWSLARINWNDRRDGTEHMNVRRAAKRILAKRGLAIGGVSLTPHDRVNKSIADRGFAFALDINPDPTSKFVGTMRYRLTVDERVAPMSLVTGLDWWLDAFHTAAKAAKALGFRFELDFNGKVHLFDRALNRWVLAEGIA